MDNEKLEKQFQKWTRFMYVILGSSITFVIISLNYFLNGVTWTGYANNVGGVWQWIQLLATPPGFYLLWARRWKPLPLGFRLNTIFGYFLASWLALLGLGLIIAGNAPSEFYFFIIGTALSIALGYIWALKRTLNPRDEMFP